MKLFFYLFSCFYKENHKIAKYMEEDNIFDINQNITDNDSIIESASENEIDVSKLIVIEECILAIENENKIQN